MIPTNASSPRVSVLSREVGGSALFSCPAGYGIRGPQEAACLPGGEWSQPFPICVGKLIKYKKNWEKTVWGILILFLRSSM